MFSEFTHETLCPFLPWHGHIKDITVPKESCGDGEAPYPKRGYKEDGPVMGYRPLLGHGVVMGWSQGSDRLPSLSILGPLQLFQGEVNIKCFKTINFQTEAPKRTLPNVHL